MRVVVQRVSEASVEVDGKDGLLDRRRASSCSPRSGAATRTPISTGWRGNASSSGSSRTSEGKMNRSVLETEGAVLVVSQFTLYGDCRKGRRPDFLASAPADEAHAALPEISRDHERILSEGRRRRLRREDDTSVSSTTAP